MKFMTQEYSTAAREKLNTKYTVSVWDCQVLATDGQ